MLKRLSFRILSLTSIPDRRWFLRASRIQQAFYILIPEDELPLVHLKLARTLKGLILPPELPSTQDDLQDETSIFVQLYLSSFSN